jgi:hypothetical protein
MIFPLDLGSIALLVAVTAIILLVTSEVVSLHQLKVTIFLNKKRLRNMAIVFSVIFLIIMAIQIAEIISAAPG